MSVSLPFALIAAWIVLFGCINTHQRHVATFKGSSQGFRSALLASTVLGTLVALGLLVLYFTRVAWYWPLALFAMGAIGGGLIFGVLDAKIGQPTMSLLAFGWPAAAYWVYVAVGSLPQA